MTPVNDQAEQVERLRGLGLPADLAMAEANSWRRWLPIRTMPWKELEAFEVEVEQLEERHREAEAEAATLTGRIQSAPAADMDELARWERGGRGGPRPAPSRPELESDLASRQDEMLAIRRAVDSVTSERASYVTEHRGRLTKDASRAADQALQRVTGALDELERARAALVEARRVELWALLYPAAEAGREPVWAHLAGGLRRALEPLGVSQAVGIAPVFDALRADAAWLADAASPEQRQRLTPREVSPEERGRERDRLLDAQGRLHQQAARDQRLGELHDMKRRI